MKKLLALTALLFLFACGDSEEEKMANKYLGTWVQSEHEKYNIIKEGNDYFAIYTVNNDQKRYPATIKGNMLYWSQTGYLELSEDGQAIYRNGKKKASMTYRLVAK